MLSKVPGTVIRSPTSASSGVLRRVAQLGGRGERSRAHEAVDVDRGPGLVRHVGDGAADDDRPLCRARSPGVIDRIRGTSGCSGSRRRGRCLERSPSARAVRRAEHRQAPWRPPLPPPLPGHAAARTGGARPDASGAPPHDPGPRAPHYAVPPCPKQTIADRRGAFVSPTLNATSPRSSTGSDRSSTSSAGASPRPGTSWRWSADRSATRCSAAGTTTSTSRRPRARTRSSACSPVGPTRRGTSGGRSARSGAARGRSRSRSRRTAPRSTTRPRASRRSTSATRLEGDLGRRDFTVNAMAVRVPSREFVDPYGGVVDLAQGVLRTPGRPEDSFSDDPLRMMRAARFAAQLGFAVDPAVVAAMTGDGRPDRDRLGRAGPRRAGQAGARGRTRGAG